MIAYYFLYKTHKTQVIKKTAYTVGRKGNSK